MGATEAMGRWILDTTIEDIPPDTLRIAQESCFDCIGVMLAGVAQPVGQIISDYVSAQNSNPEATIVGSGFRTSLADAALANGTMGHALDFDDFGGFGHPTVAVLPALLPLCEKTGASGRRLMEAFVIGCEVGMAVHLAAHYNQMTRGFHATSVIGRISGTAACAKILNLTHGQTVTALGIAGSMASGVLHNLGTMTKPLHAGLAARDSVMAVQLASMGITAGQQILEHPVGFINSVMGEGNYDLKGMVDGLGKPFLIQDALMIKKYPTCGTNHGLLDSLLGLMLEHQFNYQDVEWVEINQAYVSPVMLFDQPEEGLQGKFSARFNTAAALVDGKVNIQTFTRDRIADPAIQDTMAKVWINIPSRWNEESGAYYHPAGRVRVKLADGREMERSTPRDQILGSQKNPWGMDNITEKFRSNACYALPPDKVTQAIQMWSCIDQIHNIADAIPSLVANGK